MNPDENADQEMKKDDQIDFNQNMENEDPLEILKLKDPNVHIFSIPPMSSSTGHTTSDFTKLLFKGTMKMVLKGELMYIYFLNSDNTIFLVSIVDVNYDKFIVPVSDSSRYFSIKAIDSQGTAGWYGLAFKQRNGSFDFKTTLQDFKDKSAFEKTLETQGEYKPKYDFSLPVKEKPKENNLSK